MVVVFQWIVSHQNKKIHPVIKPASLLLNIQTLDAYNDSMAKHETMHWKMRYANICSGKNHLKNAMSAIGII